MEIHIVRPGDTLYKIAREYGVPMSQLLRDNGIPDPARLSVGQAIVVQFPEKIYTVRPGDTLSSIARSSGLSLRQLLRNNFGLSTRDELYPGETLVLSYRQSKLGSLSVNAYAYPYIDQALLHEALPYLSDLSPFTYGLRPQGGLVQPEDGALLRAAMSFGVRPLLHLST